MNTKAEVLDWLLEPENPTLRCRPMTELLNRSPEEEAVQCEKSTIPSSKAVRRILEKMHPDGTWLTRNKRTGEVVGAGAIPPGLDAYTGHAETGEARGTQQVDLLLCFSSFDV